MKSLNWQVASSSPESTVPCGWGYTAGSAREAMLMDGNVVDEFQ